MLLFWILIAIVAFFWALGRFSRSDPKKVAALVRRISGAALVLLGGYLTLRGEGIIGAPLAATGLGLMGYGQFANMFRRQAPPPPPPGARPRAGMSRAEALAILGLDETATAREIKAAHRRLMKQHHPDKGGDGAKAARINAAKETLIG